MEDKEYAVHPMLAAEMYPEAPQVVETETEAPVQFGQRELMVEAKSITEVPVVENQVTQEQPQENSIGKNLRMLREKAERAERERDEMMRLLQMERDRGSKYVDSNIRQQVDDINISHDDTDYQEDEMIEGKHLNKVKQQIKALEQKLRVSQGQSTQYAIEAKIKAQYPDFDQIVSRDNIELLNAMDPVLANALSKSPDLYEKAISTYNVIKKFNIPNYDKYESETKKIQENRSKPRSLASVNPQKGDSPLTKVNMFAQGLTKDVKEMLNKEMNEAISNRNQYYK